MRFFQGQSSPLISSFAFRFLYNLCTYSLCTIYFKIVHYKNSSARIPFSFWRTFVSLNVKDSGLTDEFTAFIYKAVLCLVSYYKWYKLYSSKFPDNTVSNTQRYIYSHSYIYIFIYTHTYEKSIYLWLLPQMSKLHRLAWVIFSESNLLKRLRYKIDLCSLWF